MAAAEIQLEQITLARNIFDSKEFECPNYVFSFIIDMTSIPPLESLWSCNSLKPRAPQVSYPEKIDQKSGLLAPAFRQVCQTGLTKRVHSTTNIVLASDNFTEEEEDKSLLSQNTLKLLTDPSSWNLSTEKDMFSAISSKHRLGCSDPTSLDPPVEPTKLLGALTFPSSLASNHSTVSTLKQVTLDRASFPDDLNARFHSHCLDSSFSGEIMSIFEGHLQTAEPPLVVSASAVTACSTRPEREHGLSTSMTFPKIRTPTTPRDSIQLAKRHYSQPQSGTSSSCRVMSFEASTFQPIKDSPVCHRPVEETDIDDDAVLEKMETEGDLVREEAGMCEINHLPTEQREVVRSKAGVLEPGGKPPTPPLHRFPSWVRNAGTTVQEVLFIFERCPVAN